MAEQVVWSPEAIEDLDSIAEYISRDSRGYAGTVVAKVLDLIAETAKHPMMGMIVPEVSREDVRERFVYSYRIVYQVQASHILVLAIIHGRRLLETVEERFGGG